MRNIISLPRKLNLATSIGGVFESQKNLENRSGGGGAGQNEVYGYGKAGKHVGQSPRNYLNNTEPRWSVGCSAANISFVSGPTITPSVKCTIKPL